MATKRKRKSRGGRRIGAGRPSLYHPKTVKLGVKITERAHKLIQDTAETLETQHGHYSEGDAVEYLARKATGTPTDADPDPPSPRRGGAKGKATS